MYLSKKLSGILLALIIASVIEIAMVAGFYATVAEGDPTFFNRIFVLAGGNF